jgi:hypothetical protein
MNKGIFEEKYSGFSSFFATRSEVDALDEEDNDSDQLNEEDSSDSDDY